MARGTAAQSSLPTWGLENTPFWGEMSFPLTFPASSLQQGTSVGWASGVQR